MSMNLSVKSDVERPIWTRCDGCAGSFVDLYAATMRTDAKRNLRPGGRPIRTYWNNFLRPRRAMHGSLHSCNGSTYVRRVGRSPVMLVLFCG
jgi:hypothetical protein